MELFFKNHPELSAAASLAPLENIGAAGTMMQGMRGLRIGQQIIHTLQDVGVTAEDTLQTAYAKLRLFERMAENGAKALVGMR